MLEVPSGNGEPSLNHKIKCPKCESTSYRKNGRRNGKQNYLCKNCGKQFLEPTFSEPQESFLTASTNGDAEKAVFEATEPKAKQLPEDTITEKSLDSGSSTLAQELLQSLISNGFLESIAFKEVIQKAQLFFESQSEPKQGIAILLLDAENIKISTNTEKYIASICQYPLNVKIAFANWRNSSMGKQDTELYERGYQLIHVPEGKNSADAKMIALGASILQSYPTTEEVIVCSSDGLLIHLCNELQNQGLSVYWVRRHSQTLQVENRRSGDINYYSLAMETEIPSLEKVVQQIESLIKAEQQAIDSRLSDLATVTNLFYERCHITSNKNKSEPEEIILTEEITPQALETEIGLESANDATIVIKSINSKEDLEKVIVEILGQMKGQSSETKFSVDVLARELQKFVGQSPNSIVKKLKLGSSFTKFLETCSTLKLTQKGKKFEVAIASGS
ncbi:MAG: NYN domain-containing protein [Scytonema sp. PMC 1069.18]|nr:NYN domain-containing protein [Scytonema sp. PMC 1069.18]MEC4887915.1 NYN domain-containing protein [Scytonema sp. PMC 1070.18]